MTKERFTLRVSVHIIFSKNDEILLMRRANTGFHDGDYDLPAGHLEPNERATIAAIREAKEEVGIDLNRDDLKLSFILHDASPESGAEYIRLFFQATNWSGEVQNMEKEFCDDLSWFKPEDLPTNIIPFTKFVLEEIAAGKIYGETNWK